MSCGPVIKNSGKMKMLEAHAMGSSLLRGSFRGKGASAPIVSVSFWNCLSPHFYSFEWLIGRFTESLSNVSSPLNYLPWKAEKTFLNFESSTKKLFWRVIFHRSITKILSNLFERALKNQIGLSKKWNGNKTFFRILLFN